MKKLFQMMQRSLSEIEIEWYVKIGGELKVVLASDYKSLRKIIKKRYNTENFIASCV